jgi:hypothetical protein
MGGVMSYDGGWDSGVVSSGTTGGIPSGTNSGGTSSGISAPPDVLPVGPTGYVDDSEVSGIVGAWYGYGDMWGMNGSPPGNCQTLGGFMDSQCSTITFPMPLMLDAGGDAAAVAVFPPSAMGMCLTGQTAKAIPKVGSTSPDFTDIFGIGIGLDLNNMGGTKLPFDANAHHVIGFAGTITGVPAGGIRVEFPTTQTTNGFQDSWSIVVTSDGPFTADLTTAAGDPHKLTPSFKVPTGMTEPPFDPTMLLSIQFHVPTISITGIPVTMLCVNNLTAI